MGESVPWGAEDGPGWPEQLAVRAAWCYYVLGLTQQDVAERLGISRVRVNRLLAEARRRGVVRITITSELAENVELEERLKSAFGLRGAHVVLATGDELAIAEVLGAVAAELLSPRLGDGITIGIGWGVTVKAFAEAMPERVLRDASVVSMIGSLSRRSSIDAFEGSTVLAQRLRAECFYMPGPIICDSVAARDTLLAQPAAREVLERARRADLAVVSIGGLESGTMRTVGFLHDDDIDALGRAGALGNFVGHYVGANGRVVDHPVNGRVLGLDPAEIVTIPSRVMVSGGPSKVAALSAVLRAGLVTELVTDQDSARALLAGNPRSGRGGG